MKVVTTNLLNRFWKNGIVPIKNALAGKLDASKVVASRNITEPGYVMDGKTASEALAELNRNITDLFTADTNYVDGFQAIRVGSLVVLNGATKKGIQITSAPKTIVTIPASVAPKRSGACSLSFNNRNDVATYEILARTITTGIQIYTTAASLTAGGAIHFSAMYFL